MTLCPIALAVGCKKCPVFKICPVKGLIGDVPPVPAPAPVPPAKARTRTKAAAKPRAAARKKK
ncbi:MAG: hypothetical protein D4R84_13945 [Rhodocyclaceae bacterium]|nr:MAG: hypothetical protein D4R84_13945 [Rhodocyclaceae bacterium]